MKEYKFSDIVYGFEPTSTITIDGDIIHVASKNGGSMNMNSIISVAYMPASAIRKGSLYFSFAGGEMGVKWSTIAENKKMNKNAEEIANIVMQYVNGNLFSAPAQTINNNIINEKSPAEQVKDLKELLDMGVITQEEFDKKKKELLGL